MRMSHQRGWEHWSEKRRRSKRTKQDQWRQGHHHMKCLCQQVRPTGRTTVLAIALGHPWRSKQLHRRGRCRHHLYHNRQQFWHRCQKQWQLQEETNLMLEQRWQSQWGRRERRQRKRAQQRGPWTDHVQGVRQKLWRRSSRASWRRGTTRKEETPKALGNCAMRERPRRCNDSWTSPEERNGPIGSSTKRPEFHPRRRWSRCSWLASSLCQCDGLTWTSMLDYELKEDQKWSRSWRADWYFEEIWKKETLESTALQPRQLEHTWSSASQHAPGDAWEQATSAPPFSKEVLSTESCWWRFRTQEFLVLTDKDMQLNLAATLWLWCQSMGARMHHEDSG